MKKILYILLIAFFFLSCKSSNNTEEEYTWPEYVRDVAREINIHDNRRLAIIDQIDDFYKLFEDTTSSADILCGSLNRLEDTLEYVIRHDYEFEFNLLMRATAFRIHHRLLVEDERIQQCGRYFGIEDYWNTSLCNDSLNMDVMSVSWFRASHEAGNRFAILNVAAAGENMVSELIVENLVDYSLDDVECIFTCDSVIVGVINSETASVDSSEVSNGLIRIMFHTSDIVNLLNQSDAMIVRYTTNGETVEMMSLAPFFFNEQVKECPRLMALLDDDINSIIGQPIKQVFNRTTGEVINLDSTWYLDTVWSEAQKAYILQMRQR